MADYKELAKAFKGISEDLPDLGEAFPPVRQEIQGPNPLTCEKCKYHMAIDHGYSNWTVEGTNHYCLQGEYGHRDGEDDWYGTDSRSLTRKAQTCDVFVAGADTYVDVDRDKGALANYTDDPEVHTLIQLKFGGGEYDWGS